MVSEVENLNNLAWQMVHNYQSLAIANHTISTPYAINFFSQHIASLMQKAGSKQSDIDLATKLYKEHNVPYGWFRGKGTPQQIELATQELAKIHHYDLKNARSEGIIEFMKLFGLGIDCSGLVYNVMEYMYAQTGKLDNLIAAIQWPDNHRIGVNYAGTELLAQSSTLVSPDTLRALDLLFIKSASKYTHVGIILQQNDQYKLVQSNISCIPTGVNVSGISLENNQPIFEYQPTIGQDWNELYLSGKLEFRRTQIK